MLAVQAGEKTVVPLFAGREDQVSLAAVNGPASLVVSGSASAVAEIGEALKEQNVRVRPLTVSHAFHSPLMEPMLAEFAEVVDGLTFAAPAVPFVSALTGKLVSEGELGSSRYWVSHAREAVHFHDALLTLREQDVARFVELGPDAVLTTLARNLFAEAVCAPSLRRDRPEDETVLQALGSLAVGTDTPVDWRAVHGPGARVTALPTHAFQRDRYWLDTAQDLVAARPAPAAAEAPTPETLAELPPEELTERLLILVRQHAADVLGHSDPGAIPDTENFLDMGFSSFTALEVRNRLCDATGLLIPPVAMYEYPTPLVLADFLKKELLTFPGVRE